MPFGTTTLSIGSGALATSKRMARSIERRTGQSRAGARDETCGECGEDATESMAKRLGLIADILAVAKMSNPRRVSRSGRETLAYDFTGDPQARGRRSTRHHAKRCKKDGRYGCGCRLPTSSILTHGSSSRVFVKKFTSRIPASGNSMSKLWKDPPRRQLELERVGSKMGSSTCRIIYCTRRSTTTGIPNWRCPPPRLRNRHSSDAGPVAPLQQ